MTVQIWSCAVLWLAAVGTVTAAISRGHDLSSVAQMESSQGATWLTTSGEQTTIEDILGNGGMDSVRLRLWTAEEYGLDYTLSLAQRFYKQGYKIYLDMHLSDTWADPDSQAIPSTWPTSSVNSLASQLRSYVSSTLKSFHTGGVVLDILSLGNEIVDGMLFPLGKISNNNFNNFATLWAAARAGVNDAVAAGATKPKVMIHLNNGWDKATLTWWFQSLFATGLVTAADVDVFGFSFYPFYGTQATLSNLQSALSTLANTYNKPMYVAETDWPNSCNGVALSENYPVSAAGQTDWVQEVVTTVQGVKNGAGVFYWEPGFINNTSLGSDCTSAILFNVNWDNWPHTQATALSSVNMFK